MRLVCDSLLRIVRVYVTQPRLLHRASEIKYAPFEPTIIVVKTSEDESEFKSQNVFINLHEQKNEKPSLQHKLRFAFCIGFLTYAVVSNTHGTNIGTGLLGIMLVQVMKTA